MFLKVSLKKNLPAFIFSSVRISYVIVDSWCRKCYHTNRNFSNLKYEFFKENVSIFNAQYVFQTVKGTSIRKTVRNYMFHFFFLSTTEYLILEQKIHRLEKISDVVLQLNSEKVIKVWKFSVPLLFCVKRWRFLDIHCVARV